MRMEVEKTWSADPLIRQTPGDDWQKPDNTSIVKPKTGLEIIIQLLFKDSNTADISLLTDAFTLLGEPS